MAEASHLISIMDAKEEPQKVDEKMVVDDTNKESIPETTEKSKDPVDPANSAEPEPPVVAQPDTEKNPASDSSEKPEEPASVPTKDDMADDLNINNLLDFPDIQGLSQDNMPFMPQEDNTGFLDFNTQGEASKEDIEREHMKLLVSHFDEQQMSRYAAFRRANVRRAAVRKYVSHLLNQPISNNVAVVLAGMSKVLIGDVIELAREIQERKFEAEGRPMILEDGEPEPLLPTSIREAWRIYKQDGGSMPGNKSRPGSGNRFF